MTSPLVDPAHLVACGACSRHVRASSSSCPFCEEPLGAPAEPHVAPPAGLSRAALHAFGVGALSLATVVTGCGHEQMNTVYGGPPPELLAHVDSGTDAPKPTVVPATSATTPMNVPAPAYGGPPPMPRSPAPPSSSH